MYLNNGCDKQLKLIPVYAILVYRIASIWNVFQTFCNMLLCSTELDNSIWRKLYYLQVFCLTAVEGKEILAMWNQLRDQVH